MPRCGPRSDEALRSCASPAGWRSVVWGTVQPDRHQRSSDMRALSQAVDKAHMDPAMSLAERCDTTPAHISPMTPRRCVTGPGLEAYLGLQGAYEAALRRQAAPVELDSLGKLCDAAWLALCEARKHGDDSNVIVDDLP